MTFIDFGTPLLDLFGEPLTEVYTAASVTDRSFTVCDKCGLSTPHHEIKQRPLTLGSVCVASLISGGRKELSDDEVVRRTDMARRLIGPIKGVWAEVEFTNATDIAQLKEAVAQAPQRWSILVRDAVQRALTI